MTKRSPIRDLGKPTVLPESTLGMSDQSNGYSRVSAGWAYGSRAQVYGLGCRNLDIPLIKCCSMDRKADSRIIVNDTFQSITDRYIKLKVLIFRITSCPRECTNTLFFKPLAIQCYPPPMQNPITPKMLVIGYIASKSKI
jgi:hypothetical protein